MTAAKSRFPLELSWSRCVYVGAASILFFCWLVPTDVVAQTASEFQEHSAALREMEYAQRMIKDGLSLSSAPDMQGLDRVTDNSAVRQRGKAQVESGRRLAEIANAKIVKFQARQEELRQILKNPDRVMDLESSDGRKSVFGVESISLPMVNVIGPDLRVHRISTDKLSRKSVELLEKLSDPQVQVEFEASYGAHLFPVSYLAQPKISDKGKLDEERDLPVFSLRTRIKGRPKNMSDKFSVTITITSDWPAMPTQSKTFDIELDSKGERLVEFPISFNESAWVGNMELQRRAITVDVVYGKHGRYKSSLNVYEHGINDLPLYIKESNGRLLDTKYLSASYVNEVLPEFEEVKKRALEVNLVPAFDAGPKKLDVVKSEFFSIWYYLAERGVKYSNATETGVADDGYASQRVRLPSEIISSKQANCIDGTILMASFAMNIGLDPVLIIRPGHMYLGIKAESKRYLFIETTMIGDSAIEDAWPVEKKVENARLSYEKAIKAGREIIGADINAIDRALIIARYYPAAIDMGKLAKSYQFVDVRKARESGIQRVMIMPSEPVVSVEAVSK